MIPAMLWSLTSNEVNNHRVFDRCAGVMNFDNLTLYDKALLYQTIQDIPGKPFSIENMIKIEEGCAKYEEDLFKEKQALHVLTTGKDLSDLIKQAIESIDPTLIVSSYH